MAYITRVENIIEVSDDNFEWSWKVIFNMSEEKFPDDRLVKAEELIDIAFTLWYNEYFNETPTEAIEDILSGCDYDFEIEIIKENEDENE